MCCLMRWQQEVPPRKLCCQELLSMEIKPFTAPFPLHQVLQYLGHMAGLCPSTQPQAGVGKSGEHGVRPGVGALLVSMRMLPSPAL